MPKQDQVRTDLEQFKTNLEQIVSAIPFEERSFSRKQTAEILGNGKTKTFGLIESGALESYLDGRSRRVTGRSIQEYRTTSYDSNSPASPKTNGADRRTGCAVTVSGGSGDGGGANIPIPPSVQLRSAHQIKPPQPRGGNKENDAVQYHAPEPERKFQSSSCGLLNQGDHRV